MSKIRTLVDGRKIFYCPGCKTEHAVSIGEGRPHWDYNGNPDTPTFTPSILVTCDWDDPVTHEVCHSFVTDGKIHFLGDCTHAMKGQTVELPEWPYAYRQYGGILEQES